MTNREIDVTVAEKIYKTKVITKNQPWGHRIDYVAMDQNANDPIIVMDMVDGYILKKFSKNLNDAMDVVHTLCPDDDVFRLIIDKEVNEGFSGYRVFLGPANIRHEGSLAHAICLVALQLQELRDNPPPKMEDMYVGKSYYFKKPGEEGFYGIHATYFIDDLENPMESWLNMYGEDKKFKYSAARLFGKLEETAEGFRKDGFIEVTDFEEKK